MVVAGDGHAAERLDGAFVTANAFDADRRPAGSRPRLRPRPTTRRARPAVAVLSRTVWETRYGGDPAALGRTVTIDGAPSR